MYEFLRFNFQELTDLDHLALEVPADPRALRLDALQAAREVDDARKDVVAVDPHALECAAGRLRVFSPRTSGTVSALQYDLCS